MRLWQCVAGAGLSVLASASHVAADSNSGVLVIGQAFCVTRDDMRCNEVVLPGSVIPYERLPKAPDGARVIYFYSDHESKGKGVLVHALEAEDMEPTVKIVPSLDSGDRGLSSSLQSLAKKLSHRGMMLLTLVHTESSESHPVRVFSSMPVEGPGIYSGQVVGLDGRVLPDGERVSFTVTRGPAGKDPNPVGAGSSPYDVF